MKRKRKRKPVDPHKDCDNNPCLACHHAFMRSIEPIITALVTMYSVGATPALKRRR